MMKRFAKPDRLMLELALKVGRNTYEGTRVSPCYIMRSRLGSAMPLQEDMNQRLTPSPGRQQIDRCQHIQNAHGRLNAATQIVCHFLPS
jgi:hypothetical protein